MWGDLGGDMYTFDGVGTEGQCWGFRGRVMVLKFNVVPESKSRGLIILDHSVGVALWGSSLGFR